ncbi:MAG: hypothetical protein KAX84_10860 [Burkholderiales bacterium]|nr:hypothetical protein [Burkholderiales bacterium]
MTTNKMRNLAVIAIVAAGVAGSGVLLYRNLDSRPPAGAGMSVPLAAMGAGPGAKAADSATAAATMRELAAAVGAGAPKAPAAAAEPLPTIDVAAERMAKRLQASGGTGDEWALLARTYVEMKRYPDAVVAYTRALEKMPGNEMLLTEQAVARKAGGAAR